ncbi:DUF4149 domain-containing protein [Methylophaga pinxianii]|uniref:DUF4149 domain-containing protein n=1 Tax=Methylophaga pinxianii TaxID=2881052 RepID=UPI001CF506CF|nr:DUF4149 domain-containing protein [Methylophaga pinxianii]MCB2427201.1 DUF4149 domain-containing protein [Methylophaga pinxianii]UPH46744.1 DUF4149 domain-containing protein [Methylophaga pinxianii]
MNRSETIGERLLLTLWVGALWSIGYMAVPLAFVSLETLVAAEYAAKLFFAVNVIGLISGTLILLGKLIIQRGKTIHSWRFWVLIAMLVITLLFSMYVQPEMASVKAIENWRLDSDLAQRFERLHLLSQNLYLMLSLAGLLLVLSSDKHHVIQKA